MGASCSNFKDGIGLNSVEAIIERVFQRLSCSIVIRPANNTWESDHQLMIKNYQAKRSIEKWASKYYSRN